MIRTLLRVLGDEYAVPMRRTIALMTAAAVLEGLLHALLLPILRALFGDTPADARPWTLALAATVAGYAVLRYAADLSGMRVGTTMLRGMYHRLGEHLARLPLGWYDKARVGEVSMLAGRGLLAAMGISAHMLSPFVTACVTPATIAVVITVISPRLGLAVLLAAPLVVLAHRWAGRRTTEGEAVDAARDREAADRLVEFLRAQPVLRAGGGGFAELDDALRELERSSRRRTLSVLPGVVGLTLIVQTVLTTLLILGTALALGGDLGAAEVLTVLVLAARAADPLLSLSDIGGRLRAARSELDRLDRVLRTEPLTEAAHPVRPAGSGLSLEAVDFRYGDRPVLDGLTLTVPEGRRLGVVGPSGAGKSTLLRLLARFHDPDAGTIRIGGADVRDIATSDLMDRIAIVFQDVYLFDGTIEENVRLGRPGATEAEVRAAASAARLDEVVERLPGGWATRVGEGGTLLSGGERQRVSIARALLKDAPIVLLDEVTSALDPVNEAAVHDGIDRLMTGRTVVMIAHRMRTVQRADRVVFLDGGRVVEEGAHDDLIRRGGRYAGFWAVGAAPVAGG
ncbi:ABC transporter ATP-binding protein [Actinoplanes sp. G11-F43]|uniref:ABC transporter ATP-binding protein n=1 Tax=Actinoplanes sp. G11-F43 TaxID=3424130 RepID=UPI003D34C6AF